MYSIYLFSDSCLVNLLELDSLYSMLVGVLVSVGECEWTKNINILKVINSPFLCARQVMSMLTSSFIHPITRSVSRKHFRFLIFYRCFNRG